MNIIVLFAGSVVIMFIGANMDGLPVDRYPFLVGSLVLFTMAVANLVNHLLRKLDDK